MSTSPILQLPNPTATLVASFADYLYVQKNTPESEPAESKEKAQKAIDDAQRLLEEAL